MAKFDDFLAEVRNGVATIARTEAADFVKQASEDGQTFVDAVRADLEAWTRQLAPGQLSGGRFRVSPSSKEGCRSDDRVDAGRLGGDPHRSHSDCNCRPGHHRHYQDGVRWLKTAIPT